MRRLMTYASDPMEQITSPMATIAKVRPSKAVKNVATKFPTSRKQHMATMMREMQVICIEMWGMWIECVLVYRHYSTSRTSRASV